MIYRALLSLVILCLSIGVADGGNVYYVKKSGSDSNNGRSWSSAWATVDKVNSTITPGDSVYFGTGTWYNSQILPPTGGNQYNVTVYACSTFTEASRGLTKLYGGDLLTGWSNYSGNIHRVYWGGPKTYVLGQDDQLLIPVGSVGGITSPGQFYHDGGSGYVYAWLYGSANPSSATMVIARKEVVSFRYEGSDYIKIFGLTLAYGKPQVVGYDARCQHTSLEHCDIFAGGYAAGSNGGGILFSANDGGKNSPDSSTYGRWNRILSCTLGNFMEERGPGASHAITTYSEHHVVVESCYIYPPYGNGIYFKDKLDANTHIGNVAKFNTIHGATGHAIMWTSHAYKDSVYGNTIYDCYVGIVNYGTATPPFEGHLFICNNTVYDMICKGIMTTENQSGQCGSDNVIKYNIVAGTNLNGCDSDNEIIGFEYVSAPCYDAYTIDSNQYYDVTDRFPCSSGSQFNVWQGYCGYDARGYKGQDPGFTSPSAGDFSRPGASVQMNRADYGDRQWTIWGAWQPSGGGCPTPNPPALASPPNGATGMSQPVTLDWYESGGATLYQVQVDNNSNFSSPELSQQTSSSAYNASGLNSGTTYYWRVRAYNSCGWGSWGSARNFTTQAGCDPPSAPLLVSPANGATNLDEPIFLDWSTVTQATVYQVEVDDNSNFSSPEIDVQTGTSSYQATGFLPGAQYYWRARAYNNCGWGAWSAARSFTVAGDCTPPIPPSYLSPPNGMTGLNQPVPLNWNDVTGATKYRVQVDNMSSFLNPEADAQPTSSQFSVSGLQPLTPYYWRVCSYNSCGWGSWTPVRYFVTGAGSGEDTTPPAISNVYVYDTTMSSARVHWLTNEPATSRVYYYHGMMAGDTTDMDDNLVYNHTVNLSDLQPSTTYQYRIITEDGAGNETISSYYSFWTSGIILDADDEITALGEPIYYSSQPTLVVTNVDTGTDNRYYFEVANDSHFVSMVTSSDPVDQQFGNSTGWKVDRRLEQRTTYYWRASVNLDSYTDVNSFQILAKPHPYPNPFNFADVPFVTFTEIPAGKNLIVTTATGERVRTWYDVSGADVVWDGTNDYGKSVAPGVYLWYVEDSDISGKLTVIK